MTGRSIPRALNFRGPITDSRGHMTSAFAVSWDALREAVGGDSATTTQVVITQATQTAVALLPTPGPLPSVSVTFGAPDAASVSLPADGVDLAPVPLL